jgi:hypothetical protein
MATHVHDGLEYGRAGEVWRRRPAETTDPWEDFDQAELPFDVAVNEEVIRQRHENPPAPGVGIVREANPVLDPIAVELGLTPDELRLRTNDTSSTGTVTRVSEERFDEIAGTMGMSPEELRDRFAGRHPDLRDPSRPGAL